MASESLVRYQFQESGVGCEAHSDPDCLCDVRLLPDPVRVRALAFPSKAPVGSLDADSFTAWAEYALGAFEALARINQTGMNEALALWEHRAGYGQRNQHANRTMAVSLALKSGLTFEQTARWFGTTVQEVMDHQYPDRNTHARLLTVEPYIRQGDMDSKQIAQATGIDARFIADTARRWCVKLPSANRLRPGVAEEAIRLVEGGMSRRQAALRLGVGSSVVSRLTRHCPDGRRKQNGQ